MADIVGQSITFSNGRVSRNRFLKSAMTERKCMQSILNTSSILKRPESFEGMCTWGEKLTDRGHPTKEYERMYETWGKGVLYDQSLEPNLISIYLTLPSITGGTGMIVFGNVPCGMFQLQHLLDIRDISLDMSWIRFRRQISRSCEECMHGPRCQPKRYS